MSLPIVLITGQLLTDAVWQPLLDTWADREVIVADNRSDDSIEGFAQRLLDNAPPKFVLIAHAMGGFVAFEVRMSGPGGHSSLADTLPAPIARLAKLAVALDAWGERHKPLGPEGFPGMCLNVAKLDGGIAFNVIPAEGCLVVSFRPPPGAEMAAIYGEIEAITKETVPEASEQASPDTAKVTGRPDVAVAVGV